jgi:hypothetical protein
VARVKSRKQATVIVSAVDRATNDQALDQCLFLDEVAELFGRHPMTVRYHIGKGHLAYRVSRAGVYLISLASCRELWGNEGTA